MQRGSVIAFTADARSTRSVWTLVCLLSLAAASFCGCTKPPELRSIRPASGPGRTIVEVSSNDPFARVIWDVGTPAQKMVPRSWFAPDGRIFFSVPPDAGPGSYALRLVNDVGKSKTVQFEVNALDQIAPRLDRVSLWSTKFLDGELVKTTLLIQGANMDVGSHVFLRSSTSPSWVWVPSFAIDFVTDALHGVDPSDLSHPIAHNLLVMAFAKPQEAGDTLEIKFRNADGIESMVFRYRLPSDAASLDSDGDDLPDAWELGGYAAGGEAFDLPGHGADPFRPDVFVEMDIMAGLNVTPTNDVFDAVRLAFARAPILNPWRSHGINLHVDADGVVPAMGELDFEPSQGMVDFYDGKTQNAPERTHHYGIWAENAPATGKSNCEDATGDIFGGSDFYVANNGMEHDVQSAAEIFMHELGHNLGQRHGGENHSNFNPVYNSVMSYSWLFRSLEGTRCARASFWPFQLDTSIAVGTCGRPIGSATGCTISLGCGCEGESDCGLCALACFSDTCGDLIDAAEWRMRTPVYAPFYYGRGGAHEVDGSPPASPQSSVVRVNYSHGMGRVLKEEKLAETTGLYGGRPIDWDGSGNIDVHPRNFDVDYNYERCDIHRDYANWVHLNYRGPRLGPGESP